MISEYLSISDGLAQVHYDFPVEAERQFNVRYVDADEDPEVNTHVGSGYAWRYPIDDVFNGTIVSEARRMKHAALWLFHHPELYPPLRVPSLKLSWPPSRIDALLDDQGRRFIDGSEDPLSREWMQPMYFGTLRWESREQVFQALRMVAALKITLRTAAWILRKHGSPAAARRAADARITDQGKPESSDFLRNRIPHMTNILVHAAFQDKALALTLLDPRPTGYFAMRGGANEDLFWSMGTPSNDIHPTVGRNEYGNVDCEGQAPSLSYHPRYDGLRPHPAHRTGRGNAAIRSDQCAPRHQDQRVVAQPSKRIQRSVSHHRPLFPRTPSRCQGRRSVFRTSRLSRGV